MATAAIRVVSLLILLSARHRSLDLRTLPVSDFVHSADFHLYLSFYLLFYCCAPVIYTPATMDEFTRTILSGDKPLDLVACMFFQASINRGMLHIGGYIISPASTIELMGKKCVEKRFFNPAATGKAVHQV